MNPPRVFLICVNRLVCEAVNVLLHREGMVLLGMETDPDAALARVSALDPDIVVVEGLSVGHSTNSTQAQFLRPSFDESAQSNSQDTRSEKRLMAGLLRLVYEHEKLRIIQLSLPDEELRIYHQEQRRFINTHDLVAAIRSSVQVGTE